MFIKGLLIFNYKMASKSFPIILVLLISTSTNILSQKSDIGIFYGRFYAIYKYKDFGSGFRNLPGSQYNPMPSIVFNNRISSTYYFEIQGSFMPYVQYTGTRLYSPGFYSVYNGGNINASVCRKLFEPSGFEGRIKLGLGIGIFPDLYKGEFLETLTYPVVDSISRGTITRDFTPVFPTICGGLDFSYKISARFKIAVSGIYQKGFIKVSEYEVYYNDGSGNNDQFAKQWGKGTFYGFQLGARYVLKKEAAGKK